MRYALLMRSRYAITESDEIYFLTAIVIEWIPVFIGTEACDIIIGALEFCRQHKALRLYAYVIMDNHVHLLAQAPDLRRVVHSFKGYTAHELIAWAERTNKTWLLNQLAYFKKRHKTASQHQLWQEGNHPQRVHSEEMMLQKMHYIHENPVRRGWVDAPEHWRYSSARNYILEDHSILHIDELGV